MLKKQQPENSWMRWYHRLLLLMMRIMHLRCWKPKLRPRERGGPSKEIRRVFFLRLIDMVEDLLAMVLAMAMTRIMKSMKRLEIRGIWANKLGYVLK